MSSSLPYPRLRHNPPTDSTDFHRCDLYKELPQNSEVLIQRTPTDSTDFHRWNLYKELPQNSQNTQKFRCIYCSVSMAGMPYHPIYLCKSVKSVGVFLYKYFRGFREICGRIMPKAWVWQGCHTLLRSFCEFREFCGSFLYKYFREFREFCGSF